jgi:hypothetical protein
MGAVSDAPAAGFADVNVIIDRQIVIELTIAPPLVRLYGNEQSSDRWPAWSPGMRHCMK